MNRLPAFARQTWNRLSRTERHALTACPVLAAALLLGLVQACHASIERGEQLRASQRAGLTAPVVVATAAAPVR